MISQNIFYDVIKGIQPCYACHHRFGTWYYFHPRFYILALIFIIFDVEIAITIPVVVVFREWITQQRGTVAFIEIFIFLLILALALVYVWRHQDIRWLKKLGHVSPLREDERKYHHY